MKVKVSFRERQNKILLLTIEHKTSLREMFRIDKLSYHIQGHLIQLDWFLGKITDFIFKRVLSYSLLHRQKAFQCIFTYKQLQQQTGHFISIHEVNPYILCLDLQKGLLVFIHKHDSKRYSEYFLVGSVEHDLKLLDSLCFIFTWRAESSGSGF